MKIGIAGVGIVGGALERWLNKHTMHQVVGFDPPRGREEDFSGAEAIFLCVPVPTVGRSQDTGILEEVITLLGNATARIFIRSTVLPGTSDRMAKKYGWQIYSMPEFLTERIADQDVENQGIVCGSPGSDQLYSHYSFLNSIFAGKKSLHLMTNQEAELAKYMHNGNGTVKVAFNNRIYQLCQRIGADYEKVRWGALVSGYISPLHTQVPGPDGKLGYGGKCFPKDMEALIGEMRRQSVPCESLSFMQHENTLTRADDAIGLSA